MSHSGSVPSEELPTSASLYLLCAAERRRKVPIMTEGVSVLGNGRLLSCHDWLK